MKRRQALAAIAAAVAAAMVMRHASGATDPDDPDVMYAALAAGPARRLDVAGGRIDVVFADGGTGLDQTRVLAWIRRSAEAIATYFGRYATTRHGILVFAQDGDRVGHATTYGYQGSATRIHVGRGADDKAFARDWVMVHEMLHVALPNLPRRALWLQEGNATYVEPIARAEAGQLAETEVWSQALHGMPRGQPAAGDGGMDGTTAWGRLYWGGATFWLMAEIAIYERSHGQHDLRDALRAISRESGGNTARWTPEQLMQRGDAATGTDAMSTLYRRFVAGAVDAPLAQMFARLGVVASADSVTFDEHAPLAALRQRIARR